MPAVLCFDVVDRGLQQLWAHTRDRILTVPSQPELVVGLPARGVAAPAFQQLNQVPQVDARATLNEQMNMGSQEREGYEGNMFLNDRPSEEPIQKVARRTIDHWHTPMRRPRQMEIDPASCHAERDRKSTRLNSSHSQISYAVFCLKK